MDIPSQNARYIPVFKERTVGLNAFDASNLYVCAIQSFTAHPSGWWVWEDSNHRPHPYQGCALTT